MSTWCVLRVSAFLLGSLLAATAVQASPFTYTYVDWSTATASTGTTNGLVSGTLTFGAQQVDVTYSGDVAFADIGSGGTDFYVPASIYTNSQVANVPTNNNIIALSESRVFTDTLTFSSPLINPVLDLVSLGQPADTVSYNFNATPVILSQGYESIFDGCSTCLSVSGSSLTGSEGDGVVEFVGTYSSISWTTTGAEYWNGFTLGAESAVPSAVPEPATWLSILYALGLAGPLGWRRWRRAVRETAL